MWVFWLVVEPPTPLKNMSSSVGMIIPKASTETIWFLISHRTHGAAVYGNMDPINIPQMLAYHTWILWDMVLSPGFFLFPLDFPYPLVNVYIAMGNHNL